MAPKLKELLAQIEPPPSKDGRLLPYHVPLAPNFDIGAMPDDDTRWALDRAPIWIRLVRGGRNGTDVGSVAWDASQRDVVDAWGPGEYLVDVRDGMGSVVHQTVIRLGLPPEAPPPKLEGPIISSLVDRLDRAPVAPVRAPPPPPEPEPAPAPVPSALENKVDRLAEGLGALGALVSARTAPAAPPPPQPADPWAQMTVLLDGLKTMQTMVPAPAPSPAPADPWAQMDSMLAAVTKLQGLSGPDPGATTEQAVTKALGDLPSAVAETMRAVRDVQGEGSASTGFNLEDIASLIDLAGDAQALGVILQRHVVGGRLPEAYLAGDVLEQTAAALGGQRALTLKGGAAVARQLLASAA